MEMLRTHSPLPLPGCNGHEKNGHSNGNGHHGAATGAKRVLHVVPYMHPHAGGPPVVIDRLCRRQASLGYVPQVITGNAMANPGDRGWLSNYAGEYPIDVIEGVGPGNFSYNQTFANAIRDAARQCDLVHVHTLWTYPNIAAAKVCRELNKPYLVSPHGMLDPASMRKKWLKKFLYGHAVEWSNLRNATGMVYTHEQEKDLAERTVAGLPAGHIVPLGADDPPIGTREQVARPFFEKFPHLAGKRAVLFLGRLHPKKGLDLLLPAFARVCKQFRDAHLVLAGPSEGKFDTQLQQTASRLELQTATTFCGPLYGDLKWGALAAAEMFVLPSRQENFAIALVEAMRSNLPVIITRPMNLSGQIVDADAGIACELTPHSVASAIEQCLDDPARGNTMGTNGRLLSERQFTWDRCATEMHRVYDSVLQSSGGSRKAVVNGNVANV